MKKIGMKIVLSFVCLLVLTGIGFAQSDTWDWLWTTGNFTTLTDAPFLEANGGSQVLNSPWLAYTIGTGLSGSQGSGNLFTFDPTGATLQPIIVTTAHDGFYSGETISANNGITIRFSMQLDPTVSTDSIYNTAFGYVGDAGDISVNFTASSVWFGPDYPNGTPTYEKEGLTFSMNTDTVHIWRFVIPQQGSTLGTQKAYLYKDESSTPIISLTIVTTSKNQQETTIPKISFGNLAIYGYAANACPACDGAHVSFTDLRIEAGAFSPTHTLLGGLTYTWNTTVGCFTVASNWSPSRTTTNIDDILTFNGSLFSFCSVTTVSTETIGQLNVINDATVIFTSNAKATLVVGAFDDPNPALYVASSSQLIFGGTSAITTLLLPYALGSVNGDIVDSQTTAIGMSLTAQTTNGIVFTSGASFQNAPKFYNTGTPFGGTSVGSIVFQSGATYYAAGTKTAYSGATGTGSPFGGLAVPATVVDFLSGSSCYLWNMANTYNTGFAFGGHTVGFLISDNRGIPNYLQGSGNNSTMVVLNDFVVASTATGLVGTSNQGGIKVGGNFIVQPGSAGFADIEIGSNAYYPIGFETQGNLSCAGTFYSNISSVFANRVYVLDGSTPQTLLLTTTLNLPLSNLSVNNVSGSGITLESNVAIISTLWMNSGNINTNGNTLSLGTSLANTGFLYHNGTNNPSIIGAFARYVPAGGTGFDFPVGTANSFNDASVFFAGGGATTAGVLTTTFTPTDPGLTNGGDAINLTDGTLELNSINSSGFWTIHGNATTGSSTTAGVALTANGFTFAGVTANARIVTRLNGSSAWTLVGSAGSNVGDQIVRTGITNATPWGDFAIAESNLPPSAGFTESPSFGNGPLPVTFADTSLNIPSSWSWNFGDGATTTIQNPQHTYAAVGTPTSYTVTLIVTNSFGTTTATGTVNVSESAPSAGFTESVLNSYGPLTVNFTDTTVNEYGSVTWSWIFGDGNTSSSQSPQHVYLSVPTTTQYSVKLIVSDSFGTSTSATQTVTVTESGPSASFSKSPVNTYGPLTVNFTDTSSPLNGNSTTWSWTFGDGSTSSAQNPQHVYLSVPTTTQYTVQLIVSDPFGTSTSVTQTVTVTESGPIAAFSPSVTSGYGALTVNFTDQSNNLNGNSTTWSWTFGDGQTSSTKNPTNVYAVVAAPTTYIAQLIVTTPFGMSTATTTISVTEPPPSVVSLLTPASTTLNVPLLFSWSSATDGLGSSINYTLQLGLDTGFTSIITTITSISSTSYTNLSLPLGPVYWNIQATSVFGTSTSIAQQIIVYDTTDQRVVASSETVTFYLGDSTEGFLPVMIVFTTTNADTVTVTTYNTKAPGLPSIYYISRYWVINRLSSNAINAAVTFSYTPADFNASELSSETTLYPADSTTTSTWSSLSTNGLGISRDTVNHTLTISGLSEFSLWTLGGSEGVPVELSNFIAESEDPVSADLKR
jgi:PKD repeat protein